MTDLPMDDSTDYDAPLDDTTTEDTTDPTTDYTGGLPVSEQTDEYGNTVTAYDLDSDGRYDNIEIEAPSGTKVELADSDTDGGIDRVSRDEDGDGNTDLMIVDNPDGTYDVSRDSDDDGSFDQHRTMTRSEMDAVDPTVTEWMDKDMPR
ncbi:hypothetical protein GCM10027418_08730 [Mariniluteicoccus endophyticus]